MRKNAVVLSVAGLVVAALAANGSAATHVVIEKNAVAPLLQRAQAQCKAYGYGFTYTGVFERRRTITDYYDAGGTPTRRVTQIQFTGTITNDSDSTKSLPVDGQRHIVVDFVERTTTETGVLRHVTAPGMGIVLHESGRIVLPLPVGSAPPSFEAGPHELFRNDLAELCAALA